MISEDTTPNSSDSETKEDTVPNTLATKISRHEQAIREFLNPLVMNKLTGECSEIRKRLREFSDSDPITFRGLVLTTKGVEDFFEDVQKESVPEETLKTLEELHEKYGILSEEFEAIWSEKCTGAKNPWPTISTTRKYNNEAELPLMASEVNSGEVTLGEFRVPPSHALAMADTLLAHAGYVIRDTIQNDESISPAEIEQLCEEFENLRTTTSEAQEFIERLKNENNLNEGVEVEDESGDRNSIDDSEYYFN